MATFASASGIEHTVLGHNQANQKEVDDVEYTDAPDDLFRGLGDLFPRVISFGSGQSSKFGATEGK